MRLTTRDLQRFVGGQMEVQNEREGYLYRGEINTISVTDGSLCVDHSWVARGVGFPPTAVSFLLVLYAIVRIIILK